MITGIVVIAVAFFYVLMWCLCVISATSDGQK